MNSTDLLRAFRTEVNDTAVPPLWDDEFVFGAIDDALKTFWRLVGGIADSTTSAVCSLAVLANTEWYDLHSKVLKVRGALRSDGTPLLVRGYERALTEGARFDGHSAPIKGLIEGMTDGKLRAYPVPSQAETITLSVFRLPLNSITADDQTLELDEEHHRCLLLWMKARAYAVPDVEAYDPKKSDDFEQRFYAYCARAAAELERKRRPAGTVAYGGI